MLHRFPLPKSGPYHLRRYSWGRFSPASAERDLQREPVKARLVTQILVSEIDAPAEQGRQAGLVEVVYVGALVAVVETQRGRLTQRDAQAGLHGTVATAQLRQSAGNRAREVGVRQRAQRRERDALSIAGDEERVARLELEPVQRVHAEASAPADRVAASAHAPLVRELVVRTAGVAVRGGRLAADGLHVAGVALERHEQVAGECGRGLHGPVRFDPSGPVACESVARAVVVVAQAHS